MLRWSIPEAPCLQLVRWRHRADVAGKQLSRRCCNGETAVCHVEVDEPPLLTGPVKLEKVLKGEDSCI